MKLLSRALWPCLMLVEACGQQKFPNYNESPEPQKQEEQGAYQVKLSSINPRITGKLSGGGYLHARLNQFYSRIGLRSSSVGVIHRQFIHTGDRCPGPASDRNDDGVIDFEEALATSGKMLIPLDSDVSAQELGNEYPSIKEDGLYQYSEAAPLDQMLEDLRSEDLDPEDNLVKLGRGEELDLETRTVIIYGVSENRPLPASVFSFENEPAGDWIPIACGKLGKGEPEELL